MITLTFSKLLPSARGITLLLSAALSACGGISNNVSELSPEHSARNSITVLFKAVQVAKKQNPACIKTAKYVDTKHLQMAVSISNKAYKTTGNPDKKDLLFSKSEAHALDGLKHMDKKHCA